MYKQKNKRSQPYKTKLIIFFYICVVLIPNFISITSVLNLTTKLYLESDAVATEKLNQVNLNIINVVNQETVTNGRNKEVPISLDRRVNHDKKDFGLDFIIAGYPKCGTSTLRYTFQQHNETAIPQLEYCDIEERTKSEGIIINRLRNTLSNLSTTPGVKRGIKCPSSIVRMAGLQRLAKVSPQTKVIVGVRHPIHFFQSFYNYRITEMHNNGWNQSVPEPESLVYGRKWKGVSTDLARYDLYMMQLSKTPIADHYKRDFNLRRLKVVPNRFKVFLYTTEQLISDNEQKTKKIRDDLKSFLQLKYEIPPFSTINKNHIKDWPESFDICQDKYKKLRSILISQGEKARHWIVEEFIYAKDVFVGDKDYFLEDLKQWSIDPCNL